MRPDLYIAIMVAAAHGRGLHLTADEVDELAADEAIKTRALNGLEAAEWPEGQYLFTYADWRKINPRKRRQGDNLAA
jgi:hypothetical protein